MKRQTKTRTNHTIKTIRTKHAINIANKSPPPKNKHTQDDQQTKNQTNNKNNKNQKPFS